MTRFADLGVQEPILAALEALGYHEATPVQAAAIPVLLDGRDALVQAETGSGKTAAFGIPAVVVGSKGGGLRVVVLVPTRELARQVSEELRAIGTGSPFRCVAVTGGLSEEKEERALGGDVRCVVATPGRLKALLEAGKVRTNRVELVVLDEADRMLDMGFRTDVEELLDAFSRRQQTALISATLESAVTRLAQRHLHNPADVRVGGASIPKSLEHLRLNVFDDDKQIALVQLLRVENPERAIVFLRTKKRAAEFTKLLKTAGFAADALQGNMTHEQRRHVFDLFTRGVTRILVATDLGSRGLDVPEMQLVVNVDLPDEDDTYLHRAGRAARLGREGRVLTFILPKEKSIRERLEALAGTPFQPYRLDFRAAAEREAAELEAAQKAAAKEEAEMRAAAKARAKAKAAGIESAAMNAPPVKPRVSAKPAPKWTAGANVRPSGKPAKPSTSRKPRPAGKSSAKRSSSPSGGGAGKPPAKRSASGASSGSKSRGTGRPSTSRSPSGSKPRGGAGRPPSKRSSSSKGSKASSGDRSKRGPPSKGRR